MDPLSQISVTRLLDQARTALRAASEALRTGQYATVQSEAEAAADAYQALALITRRPDWAAQHRKRSAQATALATWAQRRVETTVMAA